MKTITYTPGKWTIKDTKKITDRGRFIIECDTNVPGHKGTVATVGYLPNARLIAAAPDLLEACKKIIRRAEQGYEVGIAFSIAKEALAKIGEAK